MIDVCVLMSTYNGEQFIKEQINSLLSQKDVNCHIYVRDDGSTDRTKELLDEYKKNGALDWYCGENLKPAKSFMDLVRNAPVFEYYAFCDQDDIWLNDKLKIAIDILERFDKNKPALYYGRPRLVDASLTYIKNPKSSLDRMTDFASSIINSNATGCTMVFNKKLLDIVNSACPEYIPMHDIWFHKVCVLMSGNVFFDDDVHILYRQHGNNQIGITNSVMKKIFKHLNSLKKKENNRSRVIVSLIHCYGSKMSKNDLALANLVADYDKSFSGRMKLFFDRKIKTDYVKRNILYKIAVLFGAF